MITNTLSERGNRYGCFVGHAEVTQDLKMVIAGALATRGKELAPDQQEALDMICHKIGRIVCGDPDYADSWIDIAGYAKLVANRLEEESTNKHVVVNKRSDNISMDTNPTPRIGSDSYSHVVDPKTRIMFTPSQGTSQ